MSTMQINSRLRRIHAGWYVGAFVLVLGVVAQVLYSTGAYDSWRNGRSLDQACDGTLAQGGLDAALGSSNLRAGSLDSGGDYLAQCSVKTTESGVRGGTLQIKLRWSSDTPPSGTLARYDSDTDGVEGQAAPLGNGWPGIVIDQGFPQVVVALDCQNQRSRALVAYGDLHASNNGPALTGLGLVITETAQKAAAQYGCRARTGKQLTQVSAPTLGKSLTAKPLAQAQGSCAALREPASAAAESGTPSIMEYPADTRAPQVNCYLVTPAKKPGYGLYAYYGAAAKDFLASEGRNLKEGYGPTHKDNDYAWATAKCPQSTQPAVFVLYHLYDRDTGTYPVRHYSARFAASAVTAFADHEAKQRGCTDVQMASQP
ncbi:hypothetical protein [Streptomyces sp. NBC_01571]|uniref:hypothetical protein n=1 Tax=Streptomyces sp. NBC_01571 TaxID=2975883 RepID=UPI00224C99D3|nr:hypothetical protein [Streptomyces sp. NBC_01571]